MQGEAGECGLCCVAMIANYYGYRCDLVSLRRTQNFSGRGATLHGIVELSESLGLSTRPLRLELEELGKLNTPAILHWNLSHYVVLKKAGRRSITIHDPAVGIRRYSLRQAGVHFTGVALELACRQDFTRGNQTDPLRFMSFWQNTRGLGVSLAQLLCLSVLMQVLALATPFYIQVVVDDVLVKHDTDLLNVLALGFLCLTLLSVAGKLLRGFTSLYLVNQLSYNVSNSVLHHLLRLPMAFFESRHMGDVISRFNATRPIQDFITGGAISVLIDGLLAAATLALMLLYAPWLTAVTVASLLLYALFRGAQYRPLRAAQHENIEANAKLDTEFMETVRALQSIKLANKEVDRQINWRQKFAESVNTDARVGRLTLSYEAINSTLTGCEYVLIIYLGAREVLANVMTIGMLYAFLAYRSHFNAAIVSIINTAVQFRMLRLHLDRLSDITQTQLEPGSERPATLVLPVSGGLTARGLCFRYADNEPAIFTDFDIDVQPGQFVAVYGPSGVGKTTLLKCLMAIQPASAGTLYFDGHAHSILGHQSLRRQIAAVLQNDLPLGGTIRENVTFFEVGADQSRMLHASKLAMLHDEISATPMGYDTLIGDMGASLSAGQQQRILIARSIYRQPRILFMDEGTAHIDQAKELQIMSNLKQLNLTCVYVTHNPRLLEFAEQVVVWEQPGQPVVRQAQRSGAA